MREQNGAFFILDYSLTGGVERVVSTLSSLFYENGFNFNHLISLSSANKEPQIPFPKNLKVTVLSNGSKTDIEQELSSVLKKNNITTLIFQGDNMSTSLKVLKAAESAGCRAILHYHGSPYAYFKKYIYGSDIIEKPLLIFNLLWAAVQYPFKKNKLKKVINNATGGLVCVSNGLENELKHIYALQKNVSDRIITIHNPLSFTAVDSIDISQKEKMLVYVSRLYRKHKNSLLVLKAWHRIAKENEAWHLYIIGDGKLRKKMEEYVIKNKVPNVIFTGLISNVEDYLKRSSISLLTSDCEGFGMGLMESAGYKNAVISTRSDGGVYDIVEEGITGYLVPKNDDKSFSEKLQVLISNEPLREKMAENVFQKIKSFSDAKIIAEWKNLLQQK